MAMITVEGVYENGRVELAEQPEGITSSKVMVTFLSNAKDSETRKAIRTQLRQKFLARLQRGVDFGTEPLPRREDLYADVRRTS